MSSSIPLKLTLEEPHTVWCAFASVPITEGILSLSLNAISSFKISGEGGSSRAV